MGASRSRDRKPQSTHLNSCSRSPSSLKRSRQECSTTTKTYHSNLFPTLAIQTSSPPTTNLQGINTSLDRKTRLIFRIWDQNPCLSHLTRPEALETEIFFHDLNLRTMIWIQYSSLT